MTLTISYAGHREPETRDLDPGLILTHTNSADECTNVTLDVAYPTEKPFDTFDGQLRKGDTLRIGDGGITLEEG